jgi:hypothetical protein
MAIAAMTMVSAGGFSGVSFHIRFPQGVASVLCQKTPIFWSRRSKLDNLTVLRQSFLGLPFLDDVLNGLVNEILNGPMFGHCLGIYF